MIVLWPNYAFFYRSGKSTEKKWKHTSFEYDLPDGCGLGDHIKLLQIFLEWDKNAYDTDWCKDNGLQVTSLSSA